VLGIEQPLAVADPALEAVNYLATEGVRLRGARWQVGVQGALLAGAKGVLLVIVEHLILYVLIELHVAGDTYQVAAGGRAVLEPGLDPVA
jgi:hypothetical protein